MENIKTLFISDVHLGNNKSSPDKLLELKGFDEDIEFCEDYWLSKQIHRSKFGIVKSKIYTSDRRFKKMGYGWMIKNFIKSYLNRNNREYFTKDFKYWV